jgi:predicted DNA-binding transcriptional regulator AlpA
MPEDEVPTRYLRKREILADLGINSSTLWQWTRSGRFPLPLVLNPGSAREIPIWKETDYREWLASRPQRPAKRVGGRRAVKAVLRRPQ